MLTAVATKSLKIVIFNHLMLVDVNCDDSVTIPRCPNLVVDLKVSALKKNFRVHMRTFWAPPYFKSWIHPWLVLVSHDVQNGISYDFDFVRWPLHFEFPSYTSAFIMSEAPHTILCQMGRPNERNGQAERAVQIFKKGMKRSTSDSLETRVSRFLFHYRSTPNTTTGHTPAELMMGCQLRSHMTLVRPSIAMQVSANQQRQKDDHDKGAREKHFKEGDHVYV